MLEKILCKRHKILSSYTFVWMEQNTKNETDTWNVFKCQSPIYLK